MTYIGIVLCALTPFLLLFAEPVMAWLDRRRQQ